MPNDFGHRTNGFQSTRYHTKIFLSLKLLSSRDKKMLSLLLKDVPMGIVSTFRKMEEEAVDGAGLPPGAISIDDLVEMYKPLTRLLLNGLIIKKVAASISLLSSSALIWMIRRSYVGLSKTQNRILVALSMADISNAMGHLCSNLSTPSGMSYMLLGSHGNDTSCIINGFFTTIGFIATPLYTCSLVSNNV